MAESTSSDVDRFHDFRAKLGQGGMRQVVIEYLRWRRATRHALAMGAAPPPMPAIGPLSINLDLTTACNFACDHCIDWEALNSPVRHRDEELRFSLRQLAARGLRSVILIGGGEPTLYPGFGSMVVFLKELGLQVAVVSNGSCNPVIAEVAHLFTEGDWVRLSLDSGSDITFQAMHRPRRPIALDQILRSAGQLKQLNPALTLGYSFVITWRGARREDVDLVENVGEMGEAARLARASGFDYISYKPFLSRTVDGAEVLEAEEALDEELAGERRIRVGLEEARQHEGGGFRVIESTNLRVLLDGTWREYTHQPRECHMQLLRQVLSPLGVYNCPAHRGVEKARIGGAAAWADGSAVAGVARLLESFDASVECREVTCLYHPVNHFLEELVSGGADLDAAIERLPDLGDAFL